MSTDPRPLTDRLEVGAPSVAALAARVVGRLPGPLRRRALQAAFDRAQNAFNRGDIAVILALFADGVEYGPPPPLHDGGPLQGRRAVSDFWRDVLARYDSRIENLSLEESSSGRFTRRARLTHRPLAGGETLDYVIVQTTEVRSGRFVRQINVLESGDP